MSLDYPEGEPMLMIGEDLDVTNYLVCGGLNVTESPVYDNDEFVNVLGETRRTQTGIKIALSASLCMIPAEDAETIAEALSRQDENGRISITYAAPVQHEDVKFDPPEVRSVLRFEENGDGGSVPYYDISFSTSGTVPLDGL
jgi:hypothetical protein